MSHKADKIMEDIMNLDVIDREDLFNQLVMNIDYGLAEFDDVEREMEKVEELEKALELVTFSRDSHAEMIVELKKEIEKLKKGE